MEPKALIIRPGALGDTLMLLPALKDIRKSVRITVAGREPGLSFLKQTAAECINIEGLGWHRLFQKQPDPRHQLPVPPQDVVVAYLDDTDGRIDRNLRAYFPGALVHVLPAYPAAEDEMHVAYYLCETLAGTGLPVDPERAMERVKNRALLRRASETMPGDRIVVHPGSGSFRKNLPPEFWTAFLDRIVQEPALQSHKKVVLLGPAEEAVRDFFGKRLSRATEMVSCPQDEELVSLLERASLYAGHDSGVTHLAAMLGIPTIAVFKDSNVFQWHPLGPAARVVVCQGGDREFLEQVIDTAMDLLVPCSS